MTNNQVHYAKSFHVGQSNHNGPNKHQKIAVVAPSNAVANPGAMMIEFVYAVVANAAVDGSNRSIYLTCV